jgi:hydroxypyruvate reductase
MPIYSAVKRLLREPVRTTAATRIADADRRSEAGLRIDAEQILQSAVGAVDPEQLVRDAMTGRDRAIPAGARVRVAGFGKAVIPMARGLTAVLGDRITDGILIAPVGAQAYVGPQFEIFVGGHPIPDQGGDAGARAIRQLAREADADDYLICLVSSGGSALLTLPPDDLPLDDVRTVTGLLLQAGVELAELNCVRKHLDALKGGQLLREAHPARVLTLVLSHVDEKGVEVVGSGPTLPDPTRFGDAVAVLRRHGLWSALPLAARGWLDRGRSGEIDDTPGPGDSVFLRASNLVIGDPGTAARGACTAAERLGYEAQVLTTALNGDPLAAGEFLAETARIVRASRPPGARPVCLVTTGQSTTCPGEPRSGRNQTLALAAAAKIDGLEGTLVASMNTSGCDAPTEAAGATATGSTLRRAAEAGLDARNAPASGTAYGVFAELEDLIVSGPTGTDVADLQIVLLA